MKWQPSDCEYGDMVRVKLGSVYHYGIFVSEDRIIAFGLPPAEKYRDDPMRFTVCATDADVFSCGQIIEKAVYDRKEQKKKHSPEKTVSLAESRLGETGYDIIRNNCEHFANECAFGVSVSYQEMELRSRWLARPVCDVYLSAVPETQDCDGIYPAQRASEIAACRAPALKAAKCADWRLLETAARHSFDTEITDLTFKKTVRGRWTCDGFDFSLSHTDAEVAVAVSNAPVGVDMESIGDFTAKRDEKDIRRVYDRFLTKNEKALYTADPRSFLICWTKKEAEFKRRAKGFFRPGSIDVSLSGAQTYVVPGYQTVLSVSADNISKLRVFSAENGRVTAVKPERID